MRKCCTCKILKPLSCYRKDSSRKDGIHRTCNDCNKAIQKAWYAKNKEKARTYAKVRHSKKKDEINARRRHHRQENIETYRLIAKKRYNPDKSKVASWRQAGIKDMTLERYKELLVLQNDSCAICHLPSKNFKRKFNVDHDHATGLVRGLLCDCCNRGLGYFRDSITILDSAKNYIICHAPQIG